MPISIDSYGWAIEELSLSGAISLYPCSRSTVYRWAREINERLEREHANWRVKPDIKDFSLTAYAIPEEQGNALQD